MSSRRHRLANAINALAEPPSPEQRRREAAIKTLKKRVALFTARTAIKAERLLCDHLFTAKVAREHPTLVSVTRTKEGRGEGTFGTVSSAKIHVRTESGNESSCVAVMKRSKLDNDSNTEGFDLSILNELSIYSRLRNFNHAAKCMFAKLTHKNQDYLMENYVIDIFRYMRLYDYTEAQRAKLAKAILYQVALGLKEFHDNKMLHKDLKPANMLVRHDGRVMLTDYGLSIYNPAGVKKPVRTYFMKTTQWYEPPEANAAGVEPGVEPGLSDTFDIWSLGMIMFELMTDSIRNLFDQEVRGHIFPAYRSDFTLAHYKRAVETILDMVGPTAPDAATYKHGSDADAYDLLSHMLDLNPRTRFTADQVLKHPWFEGYTVRTATQTVRHPLDRVNINVTQTKKANVLRTARRRGEHNAKEEAVENYISLLVEPPEGVYRNWMSNQNDINQKMYKILVDWMLELALRKLEPWIVYVHALEILDRFLSSRKNIKRTMLQCYGSVAMMIAGKMYTHQGLMLQANGEAGPYDKKTYHAIDTEEIKYYTDNAYTLEQLAAAELEMIKVLNYDLFPVKGGIVEELYGPSISEVSGLERMQRMILATVFYIYCYNDMKSARDIVEFAKRVQENVAKNDAPVEFDEMGILAEIRSTQIETFGNRHLNIIRKILFNYDMFPDRDIEKAFGMKLPKGLDTDIRRKPQVLGILGLHQPA